MGEFHPLPENFTDLSDDWSDLRDAAALELQTFSSAEVRKIKDKVKEVVEFFLGTYGQVIEHSKEDIDSLLDEAILTNPIGVDLFSKSILGRERRMSGPRAYTGFYAEVKVQGLFDLALIAVGASDKEDFNENLFFDLGNNEGVNLDFFYGTKTDDVVAQLREKLVVLVATHELFHHLLPIDASLRLIESMVDYYLMESFEQSGNAPWLIVQEEVDSIFFTEQLKKILSDSDIEQILNGAPFFDNIFSVIRSGQRIFLVLDVLQLFQRAHYGNGLEETREDYVGDYSVLAKKYEEEVLSYLLGNSNALTKFQRLLVKRYINKHF